MLIRVEIPIDAPGIDALLRRSFNGEAGHQYRVHQWEFQL